MRGVVSKKKLAKTDTPGTVVSVSSLTSQNRNHGRTRAGPGLIQGRVATGWSRAVTLTVL